MLFTMKFTISTIILFLFVLGISGTSIAQELKLPSGKIVAAENFPYLAKRPNPVGFLKKGQGQAIALAVSKPPCPSYSFTGWGGSDPYSRSVAKCNAYVEKELIDYPAEIVKKCKCSNAVLDMRVIDETTLQNNNFYAILKVYIKNRLGKITTQRGFLEYEIDDLVKQDGRLINLNFEELCKGSLTFSLGDGSFDLNCFGGSIKARGIVEIVGLFSKKHAVGSAVLDNGEVFAFISGLNNEEIEDRYPGFPDVVKRKQSPGSDQSNR